MALKETKLNESQAKVDELYQKQLGELERLSGLSTEDAKKNCCCLWKKKLSMNLQ